jgi:hypothetical protein
VLLEGNLHTGSAANLDAQRSGSELTTQPSPLASTAIGRTVRQNEVTIGWLAETLLLLIDEKLKALREALPNSDAARQGRDQEIADYERLKEKIQAFLNAVKNFSLDHDQEPAVVNTTTSLEQGISSWWKKDHIQICRKAFDMGLFTLGLSICVMAGSGGALAAIVPGILVGGRPVVEALKAWSKEQRD